MIASNSLILQLADVM